MAIEIRAAGVLKHHIPPGASVESARTVGEAVDQLGLSHSGELIMLVNGRPAYWNTELRDGDTLSLLPGISGGCGLSSAGTALASPVPTVPRPSPSRR